MEVPRRRDKARPWATRYRARGLLNGRANGEDREQGLLAGSQFSGYRRFYDYVDAVGELVFQVERYANQGVQTAPARPEQAGAWISNLEGIGLRPLYQAPREGVLAAPAEVVYLVEGEKDADRHGG